MPLIQIDNPGLAGVVTDIDPQELENNAFSSAQNFRFDGKAASKVLGHSKIFDPPSIVPYWLMPVATELNDFWVYAGLTKVYTTDGASHFNITRQTAAVDVDYSASADQNWNGGIIGGIPITNNGVDAPQKWDPPSTSTKLAALDWDESNTWEDKNWVASVIRTYREYIIAMNITKSGTLNPRLVAWSTSAVPGALPVTWDKDVLNEDAGEVELAQTNGDIVDGLALGDIFVIYKEDSVWAMQFIGGVNVFRFYQIFSNIGIISRRCVKEFEGKHFLLGTGDVFVHDGASIQTVIDDKRREELFNNIDPTNFARCFIAPNYVHQEMWICYPSVGSTLCDKAMIWNWSNNTWGDRDLPQSSHIGFGIVNDSNEDVTWDSDTGLWNDDTTTWNARSFNPTDRRMLMAAGSSLFLIDDTTQFDGVDFTGRLERTGLFFGSPDRIKTITEVYLRINGSGSVNLTMGHQNAPDEPVMWGSPQAFTIGTDRKVNVRVSGNYIAYRIESTANDTVDLLGVGFEVKLTGRR